VFEDGVSPMLSRSTIPTRALLSAGGAVAACLLVGCSQPSQLDSQMAELREQIQTEFPPDQTPFIPLDNPQSPDKVTLGEALFFDPNLSSCGTVACASCHLPEQGFSDGQSVSDGCDGATGERNSNTIYDTAYLSHLFWDGRVQSLEQQALAPVEDPDEMANSLANVLSYLETGRHPVTREHFPRSAEFYGGFFERAFTGEISTANVAKALAAYQRTVISRDAPFDRWLQGEDSALSTSQKRGALVFFGRGQCSQCHNPPSFTDSDFHNVAVPDSRERNGAFEANGTLCEGTPTHLDPGRAGVTSPLTSCSDLGKFKTPTLRNIELTAPYGHNGRFRTIGDVLQHYWSVGRGSTNPVLGTLDAKARSIMLTDFGGHPADILNLTDFLTALTGSQLTSPTRGVSPPAFD
jgi:cytochrome c peroxidase